MNRDRGSWLFDGDIIANKNDSYEGIRESLKILMENLIASKILIPNSLDRKIPLQYFSVDELVDRIEETGYLSSASQFDIWGDTIIYTPEGEKIYNDIVCIEGFRTSSQSFNFTLRTDHWLPMMMDHETYRYTWNLETYHQNYPRIGELLKRLNEGLGWSNKELLFLEEWYLTVQAGYDLYLEEYVISKEYEKNINPLFDLDLYLSEIKNARAKYRRA